MASNDTRAKARTRVLYALQSAGGSRPGIGVSSGVGGLLAGAAVAYGIERGDHQPPDSPQQTTSPPPEFDVFRLRQQADARRNQADIETRELPALEPDPEEQPAVPRDDAPTEPGARQIDGPSAAASPPASSSAPPSREAPATPGDASGSPTTPPSSSAPAPGPGTSVAAGPTLPGAVADEELADATRAVPRDAASGGPPFSSSEVAYAPPPSYESPGGSHVQPPGFHPQQPPASGNESYSLTLEGFLQYCDPQGNLRPFNGFATFEELMRAAPPEVVRYYDINGDGYLDSHESATLVLDLATFGPGYWSAAIARGDDLPPPRFESSDFYQLANDPVAFERAADLNGDGHVDEAERVQFLAHRSPLEVLHHYDGSGSEPLSPESARRMLSDLASCDSYQEWLDNHTGNGLAPLTLEDFYREALERTYVDPSLREWVNLHAPHEIIERYDTSGDGRLAPHEFIALYDDLYRTDEPAWLHATANGFEIETDYWSPAEIHAAATIAHTEAEIQAFRWRLALRATDEFEQRHGVESFFDEGAVDSVISDIAHYPHYDAWLQALEQGVPPYTGQGANGDYQAENGEPVNAILAFARDAAALEGPALHDYAGSEAPLLVAERYEDGPEIDWYRMELELRILGPERWSETVANGDPLPYDVPLTYRQFYDLVPNLANGQGPGDYVYMAMDANGDGEVSTFEMLGFLQYGIPPTVRGYYTEPIEPALPPIDLATRIADDIVAAGSYEAWIEHIGLEGADLVEPQVMTLRELADWQAWQSGFVGSSMARELQALDYLADRTLGPDVLERYDGNGDGVLDAKEYRLARQDLSLVDGDVHFRYEGQIWQRPEGSFTPEAFYDYILVDFQYGTFADHRHGIRADLWPDEVLEHYGLVSSGPQSFFDGSISLSDYQRVLDDRSQYQDFESWWSAVQEPPSLDGEPDVATAVAIGLLEFHARAAALQIPDYPGSGWDSDEAEALRLAHPPELLDWYDMDRDGELNWLEFAHAVQHSQAFADGQVWAYTAAPPHPMSMDEFAGHSWVPTLTSGAAVQHMQRFLEGRLGPDVLNRYDRDGDGAFDLSELSIAVMDTWESGSFRHDGDIYDADGRLTPLAFFDYVRLSGFDGPLVTLDPGYWPPAVLEHYGLDGATPIPYETFERVLADRGIGSDHDAWLAMINAPEVAAGAPAATSLEDFFLQAQLLAGRPLDSDAVAELIDGLPQEILDLYDTDGSGDLSYSELTTALEDARAYPTVDDWLQNLETRTDVGRTSTALNLPFLDDEAIIQRGARGVSFLSDDEEPQPPDDSQDE